MIQSPNQDEKHVDAGNDSAHDLIVTPILISDLKEVERTQRFFVDRCPPFTDLTGKRTVSLRYVLNCGPSPGIQDRFDRIINSTGILAHFDTVDLQFADLDAGFDYYQKSQEGMPRTHSGYASGPNLMFAFLAETASLGFRNTFLMELDCVPVEHGWAEAVFEVANAFPAAWVMGSRYQGWSWLPHYLRRHVNGNAVYRFSDPDFKQFRDEVWLPRLSESVRCGYPGMAYDCLPSTLEAFAQGPLVPAAFRSETARMEGRFVEVPRIVNLAGMEDRRERFPDVETLRKNFPDAAIFHSKWLSEEVFSSIEPVSFHESDDEEALKVARGKNSSPPDLNCCIRHLTFSEGSWVFGNQFALGPEAQFLMNVLVRKNGTGELELKINADGKMRVIVRRWREKVTNDRGFVASLLGFFLVSGHRRFKEGIKKWSRKTGMTKFLIELKYFRFRFPLLRGRLLSRVECAEEIELRIPVEKVRKRGGIAIEIDSLETCPLKGTFSVNWIPSDSS